MYEYQFDETEKAFVHKTAFMAFNSDTGAWHDIRGSPFSKAP